MSVVGRQAIVVVGGVMLGAGCFSYVPAERDYVRVNHDVRARLTAAQASELDPVFLRDGRTLEGKVLDNGAELLIQVPVVSELRGARMETLHQRVRIPWDGITEMELRSLDRTRTGLLVGGGLALALSVVIRGLTRESGGDPRQPRPDPPQEAAGPLLSIPLRVGR